MNDAHLTSSRRNTRWSEPRNIMPSTQMGSDGERLMFTRVEYCPNQGKNDACYWMHVCVDYVYDQNGRIQLV
jgi:hypothetical protein